MQPAARRLGRRGGRALRPQPVRLLGLRGHARCRTRCATCATASGERLRGRASRATTSSSTAREAGAASRRRARLPRAAHRAGPGARESRRAARRPCSARSASSATWRVFTGQAAHAGATPMPLRRDIFAGRPRRRRWRSARSGCATRAASARSAARRASPASSPRSPGRTEMLLDQRHLDAGPAGRDAGRGARGVRAGGRRPGLRGRAASTSGGSRRSRSTTGLIGSRAAAVTRGRQGHGDPERPAARRRRDGAPACRR